MIILSASIHFDSNGGGDNEIQQNKVNSFINIILLPHLKSIMIFYYCKEVAIREDL